MDLERFKMSELFSPLPNKKYDVIYADPPWRYKSDDRGDRKNGKLFGDKKSFRIDGNHYPTMKLADLKQLDVPQISADNCVLFMWSTSPKLPECLELGESWGFVYKTLAFIWHKQMPNLGAYTMSECEVVAVFKKGNIPSPRGARNIRQFLSERRTAHSVKPQEIRQRIEAMFPTQNKIELFARAEYDGWDVYGNEVQDGSK